MRAELQPDRRFLKPFADRVVELLDSPIILGDAARADRVAKICRTSVNEMVSATDPGIISFCMRHNGYLDLLDGAPRDAATFARVADLLDDGVPAEEIPLFFEVFQQVVSHMIAPAEQTEAPPDEPPSLIIKP